MIPSDFTSESSFFIKKYKRTVVATINIISIKANILIVIGLIVVANPKTNSILNMLDPIIFPIAISVSPFFIVS